MDDQRQAASGEEAPPGPDASLSRRTVGGGATIATGASLLTAAAGGLLGILVARLLGPGETGLYNVSATTFLLGFTLGTLGINVGAAYFAGGGRWFEGDAFRQLQLTALAAGVATGVLGMALALASRDSLFEGVPVVNLLLVLGALPFALSWMFTAALALGVERYETFALAPLAANVAVLLLSAALTPTVGLTGAVAALAAGHVAAAVALFAWGRRAFPAPRPGWLKRLRDDVGQTLRFGLQSYAPQALQMLNYRADLFVLNAVAANAVVGRYAVALAVTELGFLLPRALSAVVMPRISALSSEDTGQEMVTVKALRHTIILLPAIGIVLVIGVLAIPLVFGEGFAGAVGPGLVLVPGVLCLGVANVMAGVIVGRGFPRYMLIAAATATPPTLVLYALLVPAYEAYGAATASTISYLLTAVATTVAFVHATGIRNPSAFVPGRADLRDYRELWARGRDYVLERLPGRAS